MTSSALEEQARVLESLNNLATSLKELEPKSVALSHYRHLPESVQQSYTMLKQGCELIHATATKYTLLGKLDMTEQTRMCMELLQGCQVVGAMALSMHDKSSGCSVAAQRYVRHAARAVVIAVMQLVDSFVNQNAGGMDGTTQMGAQKTGAVWQACDYIAEKQLPVGNRNAMRRDLLTFERECNDTMEEFQQMIEAGPTTPNEPSDVPESKDDAGKDDLWEAFLSGQEDQYTDNELPVAEACVYLVKCSRGSLKMTLQTIEAVGSQVSEDTHDTENGTKLAWISLQHSLATDIGNGMTDLGACLYPPLSAQNVRPEIERQAAAIEAAVQNIIGCSVAEMPEDTLELVRKIETATRIRKKEALNALTKVNDRGF